VSNDTPSEEVFRAVLKRAAASGSHAQLPTGSPADRLLFWATRLLAAGSVLLIGFVGPGVLILAGLYDRNLLPVGIGLGVLALSTSLAAMIVSGQGRLKSLFKSLAQRTGLRYREQPDVLPGLYNVGLWGEIRGRYVSVDFENHAVPGSEHHDLGRAKYRRQQSRKYLVVRASTRFPKAAGRFEPLQLKAAYDSRRVQEVLTPTLLSWLTETHGRDELMVGAGAVGFRWDASMTPEGLEQVCQGISLAVELAEQLERHAERERQRDEAYPRCPICGTPLPFFDPRYPRAVCATCVRKACDEHGRPLEFFNEGMGGGFVAVYRDTGEPRAGHGCFIEGKRCYADEARLGGIVVQVLEEA
jgi:hypothetical protein